MDKINVLITGIGGAGVGEQILKSLKLSNLNMHIVGTDTSDICYNKHLVDEFVVVPFANDEKYLQKIKTIISESNIKMIFPGSDPELKFFSKNESLFYGVYTVVNNKDLIEICINKHKTYLKFEELGINVPKFNKIDTLEDCAKIIAYPVVLKPNTNSGGSSHIYVVFNKDELLLFAKYMLEHELDIIAQEYIDFTDNEYTIGVSCDKSGNVLGSIILRRHLNSGLSISKRIKSQEKNVIISSGISQGTFLHDDDIKRQAEDIAIKLESKGPLNIQGRVVNNKLLLMEINPRLSGTTYLRALVGYNEPENIIKSELLNEISQYTYEDKTVLRSVVERVL